MSVALRLYEQLTEAGEDKIRAKAIADAFEQLEERYPHLKEVATHGHVRESELRLLREIRETEGKLRMEIEGIRLEIKEMDGRLQLEIREVEGRLQKEIREVESRLKIGIMEVDLRVKDAEIRLTQTIHRQTLWVVGSVGAVVGGIRLLEWFLAHLPVT